MLGIVLSSVLRAFRVTLPSIPIFLPCISIWLDSVLSLFGWFPSVLWGAMVFYWNGVPAAPSRRGPAVRFSRARVVIMQGRAS